VDDLEVTVYWHGGKVGHVNAPWSHTRGELIAWLPQRRRPFGDRYADPDDEDGFGLLLPSPENRSSMCARATSIGVRCPQDGRQ